MVCPDKTLVIDIIYTETQMANNNKVIVKIKISQVQCPGVDIPIWLAAFQQDQLLHSEHW